MKITLISLDPELYCIGIRILSSCLKENGHDVQVIFMPPHSSSSEKRHDFQTLHPAELLDQVAALCTDSGLVGISLMTNQFLQAVHVTKYLKAHRLEAPIIWGGIHPTVEPEASLEDADMVCLGEGEEALVELVDCIEHGASFHDVRNLWFKSEKGIVRNPLRPLQKDLDTIPFPDYDGEGHFIADRGLVERLTTERLLLFDGERFRSEGGAINYPVLTSRGCPFTCTYCCNSVYRRLYPSENHLRWRSAENVIRELKELPEKVAPLRYVFMVDDNFTARSDGKLKEFCEAYKKEINVPFFAQVSPLTINNKKMEILIDAGCIKVVMGVETGNERIARMYNRERSHAAVPTAVTIIESYRSQMPLPPTYQFIIDNPYETIEEIMETLRLAVSLPQPWDNPIYSLMLFPGTPLYEQACSDGIIGDKHSDVYGKNWLDQSRPFFQFWIRLYRANLFPSLLRFLLRPSIVRVLTSQWADTVWRLKPFNLLWDIH